jgi:DNA polymerase II
MIGKGWLLDIYVREEVLVLWFQLQSGERLCLTNDFTYRFYAQGNPSALRALEKRLAPYLRRVAGTKRLEFWSGRPIPVLELELRSLDTLPQVQRLLAASPEGINLYNCDLSIPHYYAYEKGLPPLCFCDIEWERSSLKSFKVLDSPWNPDADFPALKVLEIGLTDHPQIPLGRGNSIEVSQDGLSFELAASDIRELLTELNRLLIRFDPDLILSRHGDARIFPFLWNWSGREKIPLHLDRDPHPPARTRVGQGRSYFSYGQVLYQGTAFPLYGRLHVDRENSFFYTETGLEGILFLSRLTKLPVQTLARATPGTAITAMQLDRAVQQHILIPWKKGHPENFKTAWDLLVADKGSLVFQPPIGLREGVAEIDFVSMYPTIMVQNNISPETMLCRCCPDPVVPEAGYNICRKREGLVPQTLGPILALRNELKHRIKAGHPKGLHYKAMRQALKWILVTCFGYMGYKNARFGCIEAHEAITAFGRDKLLLAKECAEARGFRVLHGLTDSLWIEAPDLTEGKISRLLAEINTKSGLEIDLEGIYDWIIFLPSRVRPGRPVANRYFGRFQDGSVKIRGMACCCHDSPPFVKEAQKDLLLTLAAGRNRADLQQQIPVVLAHLEEFMQTLKTGGVSARELIITRRISQKLEEYRVNTPSVQALEQLEAAGITLYPGQRVGYVLRDPVSAYASEPRVRPAPFLEEGESYDWKKYRALLLRAAGEVLVSFGINLKDLEGRFSDPAPPSKKRRPWPQRQMVFNWD